MDQVRCSFVIHFLVVTSFKNNKKAQGKSHFSALVISLCFIGGYLPSRVLVLIICRFCSASLSCLDISVIIHQSSGNSNTYYLSLTKFEKQLPKGHFSRCHNSFLVNLSRVKEIGRTDLTLRNGDMLPVGRTYYKAFQSAFIRYINQ